MSQGAILIGEPAVWTETLLTVDEGEPFFFDHPLDHVPGTLQLFGLLDLVRSVTTPRLGFEQGTRLMLSVTFPMFCELGRPVRLGCSEIRGPESGSWRIRAEQGGSEVCAGELAVVDDPGASGKVFELSERNMPGRAAGIPGHQVNRINPANVMIGNPEANGSGVLQVPVISPSPGHALRRSAHGERSPEELIEAARQLSVLLEKIAAPRDFVPQLILNSIVTDLPCGIARIPLSFRATKTERQGRRVAYAFDLIAPDLTVIGSFHLTGRSVSREAYDRMRGMR